jgi:hypothetical protein
LNSFVSYISQNSGNLISSSVFCVIGAILGTILAVMFTPKDSSPERNNGTSIAQINILIQQIIVKTYPKQISKTRSSLKHKSKKRTSDNQDSFGLIIFVAIFAATLYSKYHVLLINLFAGLIFMSFTSIITIIIILYRNNNLDNLNKWWFITMLLVIACSFITLVLMINQNVTIKGDIYLILKNLYYLLGLIIMVLSNIMILVTIIHLFALNSFLAKKGKISYFIYRKTNLFNSNPKALSAIVITLSLLSMLFSSGIAFKFIKNLSPKSTVTYIENTKH